MKFVQSLAFIATLLVGGIAQAQNTDDVNQAEAATGQWLALTDAADYAASWQQASALFKTAITQPTWESAIKQVRAPLGALKSRKVKAAQYARSLPGAPDGEYVVIQYESEFEHKAAAIETVTPMKEKDGSWRVTGYYVK